ncbi:MAG: 3-deoxy-D-manno-octulosonate 8-phosphate phosphatase [Bacteroidetes bacterium]|nr:3-deoxy-D-manno-octulosonate 8-phosphate phosphatase [Bacteroidota bacterium]
MAGFKEDIKHVTTFIFDYDGVMTNGSVLMLSDGEALRMGNVRDGYALQLALRKGYRVAVISGGKSESMYKRLHMLKIKDVFLGITNKLEVFRTYLADHGLKNEQVLYMGDDIPDYEVMLEAGVPVCPADAAEEIKSIASYISGKEGGKGCVRDVIEQVLKIHGNWMTEEAFHW